MKNQKLQTDSEQTESALIEMGKFYFVNGKYDQARDEFNKALKLDPHNPELFYNLGLVSESKNNIKDAKKMYKKAIEIDSGYKSAKEHLEKLLGI